MENEPTIKSEKKRPEDKPDNYLIWAILVTIFCCLPLGIPAIVYAAMVNSYWQTEHYEDARRASKYALNWTMTAAIVGFIIILTYCIMVFGMGYNWAFWNGFIY